MLKPRIFISAVSSEFRTLRKLTADILLRLGYEPVQQDVFGTEPGDLRALLRDKIDGCDGLVQIVGQAYGFEPPTPDPEFGQVSYTQYEFLYARKCGKKTWLIVAEEGCTRDAAIDQLDVTGDRADGATLAEQQVRRELQAAYRKRVGESEHVWISAANDEQFEMGLERLRDEFSPRTTATRFGIMSAIGEALRAIPRFFTRQNQGPTPVDNVDNNVQFTIYRPVVVQPATWNKLLAFAHLKDLPNGAAEDEPVPVEEMQRQATAALGSRLAQYVTHVDQSAHPVPHSGMITFVPSVAGIEFNPPQQSFLWMRRVHKAEFDIRADPTTDGQTLAGKCDVFVGAILAARITLRITVETNHLVSTQPRLEAASAQRYQKIFASYSHRDTVIVEQVERHVETLGHRYLRDSRDLRAGEEWDSRLMRMIDEADVFQLFWSNNSMRSEHVQKEWEYALTLTHKGDGFICPTYWELPLPEDPPKLPPERLRRLHFAKLSTDSEQTSRKRSSLRLPLGSLALMAIAVSAMWLGSKTDITTVRVGSDPTVDISSPAPAHYRIDAILAEAQAVSAIERANVSFSRLIPPLISR